MLGVRSRHLERHRLNQLQIGSDFLADLNRARSNGYFAQQAGLAFSPVFNPAVPGSVPLTVLPNFGAALLTNSTVVSNLQTNQVAGLADFYMTSRVAGSLATFMQNTAIYASQALANGGFSDYNALQPSCVASSGTVSSARSSTRSRTRTPIRPQAQNGFEAFMDNFRPQLNTGPSVFHQTHVVNANAIYELPFGHNQRWLNSSGLVDALVGGWPPATILAWQSGSPRACTPAVVNRAGRSNCGDPIGCDTALSTLSADEIKGVLGTTKTRRKNLLDRNLPRSSIEAGGAEGTDEKSNSANFNGQVFFNPAAGDVGNLSVLTFDETAQLPGGPRALEANPPDRWVWLRTRGRGHRA